jgi:hypothetical protein
MSNNRHDKLVSENHQLRKALAGLIPWAGELPDGPDWATPEAKSRNRAMFEVALENACNCFPPDYNGFQEMAESN